VFSALETFVTIVLCKSTLTIPYHTIWPDCRCTQYISQCIVQVGVTNMSPYDKLFPNCKDTRPSAATGKQSTDLVCLVSFQQQIPLTADYQLEKNQDRKDAPNLQHF